MKYKVIELKEMEGKELGEVMNYLNKTYPGQLASEKDIWDFISLDSSKVPNVWFFFCGSLVRGGSGRWSVPSALWRGSGFDQHADCLGIIWYGSYRVVLIQNDYD